jgi:hypothetical protein
MPEDFFNRFVMSNKEHPMRSDFSMGMLDFERYHEMLMIADSLAYRARLLDIESLDKYYSILKQFFINICPLMFIDVEKEFEWYFDKAELLSKICRNDYQRYMNAINSGNIQVRLEEENLKVYFRLLEALHKALLKVRQKLGIGLVASKFQDTKSLIKKSVLNK